MIAVVADIAAIGLSPTLYDVVLKGDVRGPNDQKRMGQINLAQHKIEIDETNPHAAQREVLIHELVHAISYHYDAELTERQVAVVATGLCALLDQNPVVLDLFRQQAL